MASSLCASSHLIHFQHSFSNSGSCRSSDLSSQIGRSSYRRKTQRLHGLHSRCRHVCMSKAGEPSNASNSKQIIFDPLRRVEELTNELQSNEKMPMSKLNLFSPSKINVFLRITNKRPDGYHELASLFHVISLGDMIKFSISPSTTKDSLTTNTSGVPLDDKNLIIKALNLYRKKTGYNKHFWIHLDKRVPTGAGLGGGSGNAATALWAVNQFNNCSASESDLQEWSEEIGSDIPFFFSHGCAYCTGKGEIVKDIDSPFPIQTPMVLIKPREQCPTAEVYKHFKLDESSTMEPEKLLADILQHGILQASCVNDLEAPAFEVVPSLEILKKRIEATGRGRYQAVFMSGSGSTIVGIGDAEAPQFLYDEDGYEDVFIAEAQFLTRNQNEWYQEPTSQVTTQFGDKHSASVNETFV